MIATLMRVAWISLSRDRVAQALTFALPIAFFTIFAAVFAGQDMRTTPRVEAAVVDQDGSEYSRRLVMALKADRGLEVRTSHGRRGEAQTPLDRARAEALVRDGAVPVAVVLPKGMHVGFGPAEGAPPVELLSDPSDPVAPQIVMGLLQKAAMTAAPDLMVRSSLELFERYSGPLSERQREAIAAWEHVLRVQTAAQDSALRRAETEKDGGQPTRAPQDVAGTTDSGPIPVRVVDVMGEKRENPLIAFYAAGIGIMFLLFTCTGAAGSLLDEVDSGTLDRVLTSRAGMTGLLIAKWCFMAALGVLQLTVMFSYGALAFGLPLLEHLAGFAVMTAFSAAVVASFGLLIATASRTRAQLSGVSTIVILVISALGGSMFPRFMMSEGMQKVGLLTFNAWALDGFIKVFWRDAKLVELWPQLLVLSAFTVAFLTTARLLARRWEAA
ncbi:MAG TPA: ABC transporter permease [Candidatus Limnocylindria bacterium]|nr:ABC transporter permease [Candidatus Limnocylindria bacterium]